MSFQTDFDTAFTLLLSKAVSAEQAIVNAGGGGNTGTGTTPSLPASVAFEFAGGGFPLTVQIVSPIFVEVPFPCRLVTAHMFAGDAHGQPALATATMEMTLTHFDSGVGMPIYGSGARPSLTNASSANVDLTGWVLDFDAGDAIVVYPTVISGTAASFIVLSIQLQPAAGRVNVTDVTTTGTVTTSGGIDYTYRTQ